MSEANQILTPCNPQVPNVLTRTIARLSHAATEAVASPTTPRPLATPALVPLASRALGAPMTSSNASVAQAPAITEDASTPTARTPVSASQGTRGEIVMPNMCLVSPHRVSMMGDARPWTS